MHEKSMSKMKSVTKTNLLSSFFNNKLKEKSRRPLAYCLIDLKGFIRIRVYAIKNIKGLPISIEII
jgi:hypothetical protein